MGSAVRRGSSFVSVIIPRDRETIIAKQRATLDLRVEIIAFGYLGTT
jgi:hypothetical protein